VNSGIFQRQRDARFQGHSAALQGSCFHPSGKQLRRASYDHTVKLWDVSGARSARHGLSSQRTDWGWCGYLPASVKSPEQVAAAFRSDAVYFALCEGC